MKRALAGLGLLFVWLSAIPAAAADLNVNLAAFQPSTTLHTGIGVDGARLLPHLGASAGLGLGYAYQPWVYRDKSGGDVRESVVDHLVAIHVFGAVGLFRYGEIGLDVPLGYLTGPGFGGDGSDLSNFAQGDIRLILKGGYPVHRLFRIAGAVEQVFPSGNKAMGLGEGLFATTVRVAGSALLEQMAYLNVHFSVGARLRSGRLDPAALPRADDRPQDRPRPQHEFVWGVGLESPFLGGLVSPIAEMSGYFSLTDPLGVPSETAVEWLVGVRSRPMGPLTLQLAGGSAIVAGYGTPTAQVFFSAAWTPNRLDADGDGVADDLDRCPNEPEDRDAFEDRDGCPDPDNDNDGVFDETDQCPLEPEDQDGYLDTDGCPDLDNDADGLADGDDRCPDQPEDRDGFEDTDGCSDPDNDNDGVPDTLDRCPLEPETKNGVDDEDGCPDKAGDVVVRGNVIVFLKPFPIDERNPGSLQQPAKDMLSQLAEFLNSSKQYRKVRVEGHMDNAGGTGKAQTRSEDLANAVFDYLVGAGVDPARLETKAFGAERPVAPNSSPEGRAKNRRIEVRIIEGTNP